jgi:hypothetical protein
MMECGFVGQNINDKEIDMLHINLTFFQRTFTSQKNILNKKVTLLFFKLSD